MKKNNFEAYYIDVIKRYADFEGRAGRQEYWYFVLFNLLMTIAVGVIGGMLNPSDKFVGDGLMDLYRLAVLLPSLGVAVRRMHDVGKSGWFLLVPIYNIYLALSEGEGKKNKYGPSIRKER